MTIAKCSLHLSTLLLVCFSIACLQASADPHLPDEKRRLQKLHTKITNAKNKIRKMESREHSVAAELEAIEQNYAQITRSLDSLKIKISQLQYKLEKIILQKAKQEKALSLQHKNLANQLRAAYRSGRQQQWRLLLSQTDPSKIARHMAYYRHLNQARLTQINTVRDLLTTIESLEADSIAIKNKLTNKHKQVKEKQKTIKQTKTKRTLLLSQIKDQLKNQKHNLSKLVKNEKQLQKLINQINQSIDDLDLAVINKQAFVKLKGKLPWPVNTYSSIQRRVINHTKQGLIIHTAEGVPVRSVAHGRVVFSDWMPGYGLLVIIDHGSSYLTLYAHNQNIKKEVGQQVNAGEIIASAGASGGRSEPAVYFEIRKRKRQENPLHWLSKRNKK